MIVADERGAAAPESIVQADDAVGRTPAAMPASTTAPGGASRGSIPLGDTLATAFGALVVNKLRAVLTILGVLIGVASVIGMVSVGQGAANIISSTLQGLGTNVVFVTPGGRISGFAQAAGGAATTLTIDDAHALRHPEPYPTRPPSIRSRAGS